MVPTKQKIPRRRKPFTTGKQAAYALGMMGWSILINMINVILIYLYLPPKGSGLPIFITQVTILGIFNVIAIITASVRLVDAVYDPFIAQFSDKSKNPKGRRIPLMKLAILPSLLFCCLVFHPLQEHQSSMNIAWLVISLAGFYVSTTTYYIPYNALLPELAPTSKDKVRLATWQSFGYVMGIALASNVFNIAAFLRSDLRVGTRLLSLQLTIFGLAIVAAALMAIPAFTIDEKSFSVSKPSKVPIRRALKQTMANRNFVFFLIADFSYFIAVTIITAGLLYFITVLLRLPETIGNRLMAVMILVSFLFYPLVNFLSVRIGKKLIVVISFFLLALVFAGVFFMGKVPISAKAQIYMVIALAAIPVASLNILPNAILSEIIDKDTRDTGNNKEAIYFAVTYFFVKIAQTLGISLFAMFLIYGKDVGHDFGIRLNGVLGFALCVLAAVIFTGFNEKSVASGRVK
jgi:GPH family glycoside/pentoside/hexuronide:cation symporter